MNANALFAIGKDHTICEDYAIAKVSNGFAYAIVSDGCSASDEVDFGARVLVMSAKNSLMHSYIDNAKMFGDETIFDANKVYKIFPYLHPQALDATLLAMWVQDNRCTAYLYGDGVFIHKTGAEVYFVHVHLTSGAPDYLSYSLDSKRKLAYDSMVDNKKIISTSHHGQLDGKPFEPFVITDNVREGDVIAVISDGINSFRKADNTAMPWQELIEEFVGYKTFEGEFVIRRLSAFKRKCMKEGITHSDDISIASIIV